MSESTLSIYCPHCRRHTSLAPAPAAYEDGHRTRYTAALWQKDNYTQWWIGVCNYCQQPVLVQNAGNTIFPSALPSPSEPSIPSAIRADLDEAKQCFAVSAWRAAAVMARRAMQSAALYKGAKAAKLGDQIAELNKSACITNDLREWADVVRWVGNDAAHPNGEPVTQSDAEDILKLAEQFLHVLYVSPAIAKALRSRKGK